MEKLKLTPYFRVSGSAQASENTIQRQVDNFNLCKAELSKEFDIVYRFENDGLYFIDEPYNLEQWDESTAFFDLIEQIKSNKINAVWVSETDRLFRSGSRKFLGEIRDLFEDYNVRIFSKHGEVPPGIYLDFTSSVDSDDKKRIMRKLQEGKRVRTRLEGRPPNGRTPFGYLYDKRSHKWSLIEDEVKIIKSAAGLAIGKVFPEMPDELKLIAQQNPGGLNDVAVAKAISSVGFTKEAYFKRINLGENHPKTNRPEFNRSSIENMFRINRYCGFIEYRYKTAVQVGNRNFKKMSREQKEAYRVIVPRILDDADWDILCQKRFSRRKLSLKNQKHEYLCKDLLVCTECGVPLAARPKYPKKTSKKSGLQAEYKAIHYYTCARKQKISGFRCTASKCHPVEIIDSLVWDQVKSILLAPELLVKIQTSATKHQPSTIEQLNKQIKAMSGKIESLSAEKVRAMKFLIGGTIEESDYSILVAENNTQATELVLSVEKMRKEVVLRLQSQSTVSDLKMLFSKFTSAVDNLSYEEQREVICTLITSIEIKADGSLSVFYKSINSNLDI